MPTPKRDRRSAHMPQSPTVPAPIRGLPWSADGALQQFAVARSAASVLAQGFDTMRRIQDQAVQASVQRHAAFTSSLKAGKQQPKDAIAQQAALFQEDMREVARCWSDLTGAAFETNAELLACSLRMVKTEDVFGTATALVHA